jgi:hypothetical protein
LPIVKIPYNWEPRHYQVPSWHYMQQGGKRAVLVWHRRCLAGDTRIAMANGSEKPIRKITPGDEILTFSGGGYVTDTVVGSWKAGFKPTVNLNAQGYHQVTCSLDHRFKTLRGWTKAANISDKDALFVLNSRVPFPFGSRTMGPTMMTYDIETKRYHSFFANGYLVHNSGKDEWCLRWESVAAMSRAANYWHMLPEASQARKAIWDAVNPHTGKRRIDEAFPAAIRASIREQEMMIKFKNGSTWQVVGSDNFNSLVGSPPVGVTFSEWALADPNAWAYLRPILAENGGWAVFQTTPRGDNHGKRMYQFAVKEPTWFGEVLPVTKTKVLTPEQIEAEKREYVHQYGKSRGMALFNQEYMCSFSSAFSGKSVYPDFDQSYHVSKKPLLPIVQDGVNNGHTVVVRGWDHSGLHPACVVTYVLGRTWYIFKEFHLEDTGIEDFAEMVKIWCNEHIPSEAEYKDFGDPAGNRTRDSRKKTAADYIRSHCKINIKDGIQTFKVRVASVTKRLNLREGILLDPTECPIAVDGFLGGYGYPEIGHSGVFKTTITGADKDKFCDVHDAIQYAATRLFSSAPVTSQSKIYTPPPLNSWVTL